MATMISKALLVLSTIFIHLPFCHGVLNNIDAGPNTIGFYNYNQRTASMNGSKSSP